MRLTRRSLLAGVALLPVAGHAAPLGSAAGSRAFSDAALQIAGVGNVPQLLLDAAESAFLTKYGRAARNAFADKLGAGPIGEVIAADPELRAQSAFVASFLYTGEVTKDGKTSVDYYPWALAWSSLSFTKAPGICGGPAFGHWAHAPGAEDKA